MFIWRMSKFSDLSGRGGLAASGRWHTRPKPIVYCADEAETAYLEVLRQVGHSSLLPQSYKMLQIELPATLHIDEVDECSLDPEWSDHVRGWQTCQPLGDRWLAACRSSVLKVPSAVRTGFCNYLINPVHPRSDDIELVNVISQPFPTSITSL